MRPELPSDARLERVRPHGAIAALAIAAALSGFAAPRSAAERAAFVRENPCPATGQRRGACPGWQVDHITPLCAGGNDTRQNMQWLSIGEHRRKTTQDLRTCRRLRK